MFVLENNIGFLHLLVDVELVLKYIDNILIGLQISVHNCKYIFAFNLEFICSQFLN